MKELINKIKDLDLQHLTTEQLEQFLPQLGMNNENLWEMPSELSDYFGNGFHFWQYPNQFNHYLKQLLQYDINSYLEIGCRWGGTFIITNEFLKLKNKDIKSYTCDIISMSSLLNEYSQYHQFTFLNKSSFDLSTNDISEPIDLILIDGDHSYEGVKRDYEVSLQFKPKYIVFHDTVSSSCPGVVQFWNEIKTTGKKYYEYHEQYSSVDGTYLGLGLLEL
jgi:cephalosporin hydroxylase